MKIHHLSKNNTILNHFLSQIRAVEIQKDRLRFRRNLERIGEIMAYEISKEFEYTHVKITTGLGVKNTSEIASKITICSILRAGLPLHLGFLNYFDAADNGFIAAYRKHSNADNGFEIKVEYQAIPDFENNYLILADPMLATGQSILAVYNQVIKNKNPKEIHLAVVIASPEGISFLQKHLPAHCHLWIAAIDDQLDSRSYIVPGLGDAGDLAFGIKL
jgi:uracil phosphoribosyltransferase